MDKKVYFLLFGGMIAIALMILFSIGGCHTSPQRLRLVSGESRPVANGRAVLTAGQIGYDIQIDVQCKKAQSSVTLELEAEPSEKVCGIQLRALKVSTAKFGAPAVMLEVIWD